MKNKTNKFLVFLMIFFLLAMVSSIAGISFYFFQYGKNDREINEIKNLYISEQQSFDFTEIEIHAEEEIKEEDAIDIEKLKALDGMPLLSIDHEGLSESNPDYRGWIDIPELGISYPVYYSVDNENYLHHGPDKKYMYAGSIFLDMNCKNDYINTIIHGHNMKNGSMFHPLNNYLTKGIGENSFVFFYKPDGTIEVYQPFAAFSEKGSKMASEIQIVNFNTDEDYESYIDFCISKSSYKEQDKPAPKEKLLTLCTCHGRSGDDMRCVVCGRLIAKID